MRTRLWLHLALLPSVLFAALSLPQPLCAQSETYFVQARPAANAPQYATTTEHLNGVVISSADGKPVPRVLVTSMDRRLAVITDYEGRFACDYHRIVWPTSNSTGQSSGISGEVSGSIGSGNGFVMGGLGNGPRMPLQFQVRKPGYITNTVLVWLPSAAPDTPQPPVQLKIVPAGLITGHLYPDSGELPANLNVQLRHKMVQNGAATWFPGQSAQVNSRGEFRFADLPPGDYKVMSYAWNSPETNRVARPDSIPGLMPAFYPDAANADAAAVLHIGPGDTVNVRLTPHTATFYRVTIPVASGDAQGAGASLAPETYGLSLGFNQQAHAVEGYLPAGSYDARITTFAPMRQAASGTLIALSGQPRNASAMVHLEVSRAPVVAAPVTPAFGADIPVIVHRQLNNTPPDNSDHFPGSQNRRNPSVFVNLQEMEMGIGGASLAPLGPDDNPDSLKLQNVYQGVYRVQMQPTFAGYVASASSGTTDLLRDPLTVTGSGSAFPIEITVRDDAASITGTILTPNAPQAQPASNQSMIFVVGIPLDRIEGNPYNTGIVQQQPGQFQLANIPPGRYLFLASRSTSIQQLEYHNPDVLRDLTSKGIVVTLSPGDKTNLQIPLMAGEDE